MMYYNFGFGFGWVLMILFWGLIIWAAISLIRGSKGYQANNSSNPKENQEIHQGAHQPALNLLEERYVKGEISREEYKEKKHDLIA